MISRRVVCRVVQRSALQNTRFASGAAKEESIEDLRALVKSQKDQIKVLSDELVKTQKNNAYKINLSDDDANEAMKQRLQQLMLVLGVCGLIALYYTSKQNRALMKGIDKMSTEVKGKMQTLRDEVKELEAAWEAEIARKEEQLQQMHQQSTEQTRSIDRLTTAIRSLDKSS